MFNQHLYPDETVLWEGKPFLEHEFKRGRIRIILLIVGLVLGLQCFFIGAFLGSAPGRLNLLMTVGLILLLVVPAWYGVLAVTRPTPNRRLRKTCYAVTDQRVLILRGDKLSQYGLTEIGAVKYYKFADNSTAVVLFDSESDQYSYPSNQPSRVRWWYSPGSGLLLGGPARGLRLNFHMETALPQNKNIPGALAGLYCIQNPIQIEQLIKQAQKNAKTNRTY